MKSWENLLDPAIQAFMRDHARTDVRALGLMKPPDPGWPYALILDQIKARQKASGKMPDWHGTGDILFPPPHLVEQASSSATAHYKASLASGGMLADFTAGMGMDFAALMKNFSRGIAIERDETAAELLRHNLPHVLKKPFDVWQGDAADLLARLPACDLVYIDPQRRDDRAKGLFRFEDCSPDILALLPALRDKTARVLIKTSPVLDIWQAVAQLGSVREVHVVEWDKDCRETLYMIDFLNAPAPDDAPVTAVAVGDDGLPHARLSFTRRQEREAQPRILPPGPYLYEPSAAFQKAGCFRYISAHCNVAKLHQHTHLYTSEEPCPAFPGRAFKIQGIHAPDRKAMPVEKANLSIRNFPSNTDSLRKKLGIRDGGDDYLFACTLADERKAVIHARKI